MSATSTDGGNLKFIKDEKLSGEANSPPCTSDHISALIFFHITWCVTSQLNTTQVITLLHYSFKCSILRLSLILAACGLYFSKFLPSHEKPKLQIFTDSRKYKTKRESGEKRREGDMAVSSRPKAVLENYLFIFETHIS